MNKETFVKLMGFIGINGESFYEEWFVKKNYSVFTCSNDAGNARI